VQSRLHPTPSLTAGSLPYRRCHNTPDHQSSAFDVAGPRKPRLSTPHSHASRKNIRSDGDRASPLGSTSNSECPLHIAVVTHDRTTMSIPSRLFYPYSPQVMSPAAQYYHAARSLLFSVLVPQVPCLFICLFSSNAPVAKVVVEGYTDMPNGIFACLPKRLVARPIVAYAISTCYDHYERTVAQPLACTIKLWP
jgi:hypothetical protein